VQRQLPRYRYVIRTDIKGYYEHIDQMVLLQQLEGVIKDRFIMNLLVQAIRRTVHWGGLYRDVHQGIARGCPLSPILGALYLKSVDQAFTKSGLFPVLCPLYGSVIWMTS
jgi:RNA-directed DNA polymerase